MKTTGSEEELDDFRDELGKLDESKFTVDTDWLSPGLRAATPEAQSCRRQGLRVRNLHSALQIQRGRGILRADTGCRKNKRYDPGVTF